MNGPMHYRESERLAAASVDLAEHAATTGASTSDALLLAGHALAQAQVHATLALAAATVLRFVEGPEATGSNTALHWRAVVLP